MSGIPVMRAVAPARLLVGAFHCLAGILAGGFMLLGILLVPASADQDSLAEIRGKGYVRVCADPANLPFSSAEGSVPGYELELAKAIAERLGVRGPVSLDAHVGTSGMGAEEGKL
jgi:ABC-type amino acid transport substrate-binding protein